MLNLFKKIIIFIYSIIRSMFLVMIQIFNKRETILYPDEKINLPLNFRGRIILTRNKNGTERCVACNLCSVVCPVGCISLQKKKKKGYFYPKFFRINFSRCIFCGLCEEACPTYAIQLINDFELADFNRKNLIYEKKNLLISGGGKHIKYNFYKLTGINIFKKKKKKYVDVKKILP